MIRHATIPLSRAWNSWSDRPAEMVFLPLGVRVTPVLYSTRSRTTSIIDPRRDAVRLGPRDLDAAHVALDVAHSGTRLALGWTKADPFAVSGHWSTLESGEWGLRFWLSFALSAEDGAPVRYDREAGAAIVTVDGRHVALVGREGAVEVTGHASIAALRADFEANGYFYKGSRSSEAPVIALRFNLEMMRSGAIAAAVADDPRLAIARARASLDIPALPAATLHWGRFAGALDAIRDIVGWNTVWDGVNARPYTAVTRIWNLGAFAVWFNDQVFAAELAGLFDIDMARENLAAALAGATPAGNIACIVTSNDAWVDRSQPPHGALALWQLYQRSGERSLLSASYEALARNQRWWWDHRDPDKRGLLSCGTSDVGDALYKGTAFGARNETGMDNSATHDEAVYDPVTRTLSTFDLGLNCAAALDAEMLGRIAAVLGLEADANEFSDRAARTRRLIREELWDESRGLFANRQRGGGFVRSVSPTSFYPLLCGAASPEQAARLLGHLGDETTFGGDFVLPNATRDDPAFAENVYWRGRIWPNVNYMVWLGLRRYGFHAEARRLAEKSFALFMASWREDRIAAENYNAVTGAAMDQGDTDPFYIWAGLLPLMALGEIVGVDPWNGWSAVNDGEDCTTGPLLSPLGRLSVDIAGGRMTLAVEGRALVVTDLRARFEAITVSRSHFGCRIGARPADGFLAFPYIAAGAVLAIRIDSTDISHETRADGIAIRLSKGEKPLRIDVYIARDGAEETARG